MMKTSDRFFILLTWITWMMRGSLGALRPSYSYSIKQNQTNV